MGPERERGALWHLREDDYVLGSYRDHAYYLVRGGDPGRCMAELNPNRPLFFNNL